MQVITLSDHPGRRLAGLAARQSPARLAWAVAALPLAVGLAALALGQQAGGALLVLVGLVAVVGVYLYDNAGAGQQFALEAGHAGEQAVQRYLAGLDDRYYLLNGLTQPDGHGEIDHVLVGPRGVFVVETKAHHGTVIHDEDGWRRLVPDARGMLRPRQIGDPSGQVQRNAHNLRRRLQAVWGAGAGGLPIVAMVVFTHPHVMLDVAGAPVPVTHLRDLPTLLHLYPDDRLSAPDAARIVGLLTAREQP